MMSRYDRTLFPPGATRLGSESGTGWPGLKRGTLQGSFNAALPAPCRCRKTCRSSSPASFRMCCAAKYTSRHPPMGARVAVDAVARCRRHDALSHAVDRRMVPERIHELLVTKRLLRRKEHHDDGATR